MLPVLPSVVVLVPAFPLQLLLLGTVVALIVAAIRPLVIAVAVPGTLLFGLLHLRLCDNVTPLLALSVLDRTTLVLPNLLLRPALFNLLLLLFFTPLVYLSLLILPDLLL